MVWEWPQLTVAGLMALGLGVGLAKHGEPRKPHNFGTDLISAAITVTLLYFGGFWGRS